MQDFPHPVEVVRAFVTEQERATLLGWADEEYSLGTVGHDWCFREVHKLSRVPDIFWTLRGRVTRLLEIDDVHEPSFANVLSTVRDGVVFGPHIDGLPDALRGFRHVRANAFLQLSETGGEPVIDDIEYQVGVNDLIIFTADYAYHSYRKVSGSRRRVMCSFGYLVPSGCRIMGRLDLSV